MKINSFGATLSIGFLAVSILSNEISNNYCNFSIPKQPHLHYKNDIFFFTNNYSSVVVSGTNFNFPNSYL